MDWKVIETAPLDERVMLWWTPIDYNPYAEAAIFGIVSSYEPGKYWSDDGKYENLTRITHWQPAPERPKKP